MSVALPPPMVPAEVDLSDFTTMPLEVRMVRDSKFAVESEPEAFRAGVLLWCAAWHQVPTGSLPDNDKELSNLAGFGRVVKEWLKFREEALWKFVKCSDGRLYHPVIAEKAVAAWTSRCRHYYDRMADRLRKANKARAEQKPPQEAIPVPSFEDWNAARIAAGQTPEVAAQAGGIPAEKRLIGRGKGKGRGNREGEGKGDSLSRSGPGGPGGEPPSDRDLVFALGVPLLTAAGVIEKNARSMLAGLAKKHGEAEVVRVINRCAEERPVQPVSWIQAALKTAPADRASRIAQFNATENDRLISLSSAGGAEEVVDAGS